jgi:deoxyribonucleoside regulator
MGYFAPAAYDSLRRRAVGDICSHFVDAAGQVADRALDARVVATPLSVIRRVPSKLVAAAGTEKAAAVLACLRGGMADCLYIDKPLAAEILRLDAESRK